MRRLISMLLLLVSLAVAAVYPADVRDIDAARQFCDEAPLSAVEGIWKFAETGNSVLIARDPDVDTKFIIRILETDDARLLPGDTLGDITMTPTARKFRLRLRIRSGLPSRFADCAATLTPQSDGLIIERPGIRLDVAPSFLLSSFWRIFRIRLQNPARDLPAGLIKVYPSPAGNSTLPFTPVYL